MRTQKAENSQRLSRKHVHAEKDHLYPIAINEKESKRGQVLAEGEIFSM